MIERYVLTKGFQGIADETVVFRTEQEAMQEASDYVRMDFKKYLELDYPSEQYDGTRIDCIEIDIEEDELRAIMEELGQAIKFDSEDISKFNHFLDSLGYQTRIDWDTNNVLLQVE